LRRVEVVYIFWERWDAVWWNDASSVVGLAAVVVELV